MDQDQLAEEFEGQRAHLRAVALRMLGSPAEADDAVQESWLRLRRSDPDEIDNLRGWLTTVVARVCLDQLRSRTAKREEPLEGAEVVRLPVAGAHPETEALLADSVGVALLVVLDRLSPAERLAFVLHDLFGVPFEELGGIMGRTPVAARQLASRGRRRVQTPDLEMESERSAQREVVRAFLDASRKGDFAALLQLLDPDAVVRADPAAVAMGGVRAESRGADAVARTFSGRAKAIRHTLLDGYPALVWSLRGEPQVVFGFTVEDGKVREIEMIADREVIAHLDLEPVRRSAGR